MNPGPHTLEALGAEIQRLVAARQGLRSSGATAEALEDNRRALAEAQASFSRLLIARHLPGPAPA